MATEIDQPAHNARWLVEFSWGAASTLLVTDWEDDVTHADLGTFVALPTLDIDLPPNTGALDEKPLALTVLRDTKTLFQNLSSGEGHAPVTVKVYEEYFEPGSGTTTVMFHHWGRVSRVKRNFQGRAEIVRIEARSLKSRLDVPLGLPANPQCVWRLGDSNCQVVVPTSAGTLTVSAAGNLVTITGLSAAPEDRYWERGFITLDGHSISIRRWRSAAATSFYTRNKVPASWVGQSVTVTPGCDKTITTCRSRWNQEEFFGGFGFAIPDYQPNYENPAG